MLPLLGLDCAPVSAVPPWIVCTVERNWDRVLSEGITLPLVDILWSESETEKRYGLALAAALLVSDAACEQFRAEGGFRAIIPMVNSRNIKLRERATGVTVALLTHKPALKHHLCDCGLIDALDDMLATGNDKSVVAACAAVGVLATDKRCLDLVRRGPSSLTPAIVSHARGHPAEHVALAASAALCALGSDKDSDVFHGLGISSDEADQFDPTFRAWLMRKGFSDRMQADGLQGSPEVRAASWAERHPVLPALHSGRGDIETPLGDRNFHSTASGGYYLTTASAAAGGSGAARADDVVLAASAASDDLITESELNPQDSSDFASKARFRYGDDGLNRNSISNKDFSPDGIRISSPSPVSDKPSQLAPLPVHPPPAAVVSSYSRNTAGRRKYGPGMPIDGRPASRQVQF